MHFNHQTWLRRVGVGLLTLGLSIQAAADEVFPSKTVTIVVPYPAGGPIDNIGRALAEQLSRKWRQQVVIDNRGGANELVGARFLVSSRADGYTLLLGADPTLSMNEFLYPKTIGYKPEKDLTPIARVAAFHMALASRIDAPYATAREFVETARGGKGQVSFASTGTGGVPHVSMAWLAKRYGFEFVHVAYKGLAPALQDVMGGQVDTVIGAVSVLQPQLTTGRIKFLAMSGPARAKALPDVPTFSELGLEDPGAVVTIGLVAPGGLPRTRAEAIATAVREVVGDVDFQKRNFEPFAFNAILDTPEKMAAFIARDREAQRLRVQAANVSLD